MAMPAGTCDQHVWWIWCIGIREAMQYSYIGIALLSSRSSTPTPRLPMMLQSGSEGVPRVEFRGKADDSWFGSFSAPLNLPVGQLCAKRGVLSTTAPRVVASRLLLTLGFV
ncbi:unnamed protein product [Larinioides sclopetarius]|uniref:Uncharacterized protein n=1 Tax=Larinioides sclopetarius TaxID=280406 RepID=A0AAV2A9Q0_9ARAC